MKKIFTFFICLILVFISLGAGQVKRPEELKFPPLAFEPPDPLASRVVLPQGLRAYIREDHTLPLVEITAIVNFGGLYAPKEKAGIENIFQGTLIKGGTKTKEGSAIEERIDYLGATLSFFVSERTSSLSLSVLSKDLDEGLSIFFDVLMNPEFREEALKITRGRAIEELKQANDAPGTVLSREYEKLLYGEHPITLRPTKTTIESVTGVDLKALHNRYFFPTNIIIAAAGDFNKKELIDKMNNIVGGWNNQKPSAAAFSRTFPKVKPGVYFIQKNINQGYVSVGHLGLEDTSPDYYAVQVMNFILGGGSFTSRITSKVRSDEGLAYNTGSRFTYRWGFPGTFTGYVQTKSATVGYAVSLILKEFRRIREELVSDAEMETAINYYLESFSDFFTSPMMTMNSFANLEMRGRPMDYYKKYRDQIKSVTKQKVLEVANKYIQPEKMAIMIVGDWEPCNKGSDKFSGPLDKLGTVYRINLKDPLTGEEIK
jgi:predicted Zn-dependent peptidase